MFLLLLGLVAFIVLIFLVELEHFGFTTMAILGTLAALHFLGWFSIIAFVQANLGWGLLKYVGAYLLAGVAWSGIKWVSFSFAFRDYFRKIKSEYFARPLVTEDGFKEHLANMTHYLPTRFKGNKLGKVPQFKENKARAFAWTAYWPASVVGTLLNDPVRRIINFVLARLEGTYQKITDYIWKEEF